MARVSADHQVSKFIEVGSVNSEMKHTKTQTKNHHALNIRFIKSVQRILKYMGFVNCFYWELHSLGLSGEVNNFVN
jgi:hypothetical protein